ncbi:MAG: hypothetical protein MUF46_06185 [Desulfobacterales bacterium]|nr:hypothetical protein [Desulfobacterales bacterium]
MNAAPQRTHIQRRVMIFGLNLVVMAICFPLYYLGFFGRVEGPLSMANIGQSLAGMGFTVASFQGLLIVVFLILLSWNWVLNLIAHLAGQRLTCSQGSREQGFCGRLVERRRGRDGKSWVYLCPHGHQRSEAHFHPIRKGKLANSLLAASLAAAVMFHFA